VPEFGASEFGAPRFGAPRFGASAFSVAGLSVEPKSEWYIGSLRYFDVAGPLASRLRSVVDGALPGPLAAVRYSSSPSGAELILAWRSPTETLILTADGAAFAAVARVAAEDRSAGYLVDQTGGLGAWRIEGTRAREVLERIGSAASIPAPGEARTSRLAELPVLAASVRADEFLLLVERVYSEHLLGWISETAADFT
jgi:heterotetrameric sarcosine oxidase gamma subunit